jgi:beta-glucosidase
MEITAPRALALAALVDRMTPEEQASLLSGADFWRTAAVPRLGVPQLKVTDGPAGARGGGAYQGAKRTAAFPVGIALGATWDVELLRRMGKLLAREALEKGAAVLLGPTMNLFRHALSGRNFESYSEDPFLTGKLATAYVQGLQSAGVAAAPKHFAGNESEFQRTTISSEIPERALRELYLRPFEMVVREARPWAIMTAYNRLRGTYCGEHRRLIEDILRGEWGFDGLVMSDWGGTHSAGRSVRAGLDLEMPGPARARESLLREAERDPELRTAVRQRALEVLRLLERTDTFAAGRDVRDEAELEVDHDDTRALIRQAGAEGMVLLKNEGLLPLRPGVAVAVVGPNGAEARVMGGGSAQINAHRRVSPLEGLRRALGQARVSHAVGCDNDRYLPVMRAAMRADFRAAPDGAVLERREWSTAEAQWNDLPAGLGAEPFHATFELQQVADEAGEHELSLLSTGRSRLYLDGALVIDNWEAWRPGEALFGLGSAEVRRSLPLSAGPHQLRAEYGPRTFNPDFIAFEAIRIGFRRPLPQGSIAEAAALAARADVAVVCVGTHGEWETEGVDRCGLVLPGRQDELVAAVGRANPRTVVVLQSGGPVAMPWLDAVPAVLQAWFPGQEAGDAIADVLLGKAEPGGRLPQTFPARLEDDPTHPLTPGLQYPGEGGRVEYREGLFTGYRHVDRARSCPLFPFGFGLSYTRFRLSGLALGRTRLRSGEGMELTLEVENTGPRAGSTVVQAYVRDLEASEERPVKELKGFAKVHLEAGRSTTVRLALDMRSLAWFDDRQQAWCAEPGEFELLVGQSSADLPLSARFTLLEGWREPVGPPIEPR